MGSDSFYNIHKWKNYEVLLKEYELYIYQRPGFEVRENTRSNIKLLNAPVLEISSTHIRELIKKNKSIRYLVPDIIKEEIERNNYYK